MWPPKGFLYNGLAHLPTIALVMMAMIFIYEIIYQGTGADPVLSPDSAVFQSLATNQSAFDPPFWSGNRPAGLPLLMKILGHETRNLISFQVLFHLVIWLSFSLWVFYRSLNKYFGLLCAGVIMLMASSPEITLWNYHVLSESVSLSLVPIIGVIIYEIIFKNNSRLIWILLGGLFAFSMIRDANAYFVLTMVAPVWGIYLAKGLSKTQFAAAMIIIGLAFGVSTWSIANSRDSWGQERWFFSFLNITGQRILVDEAILDQFQSLGMPVNEALLGKKGFWGSSDSWSFYQDPELSEFREWVAQNGKSVYARFLIMHPGYSFSEFQTNKNLIFHADKYYLEIYEPEGFDFSNLNLATLVPNQWVYLFLIVAAALVYCIPKFLRRGWNNLKFRPAVNCLLMALSTLMPIGALFFISNHGDAMEVSRHTLTAVVLLKAWLVIVFFEAGNSAFKTKITNFPVEDSELMNLLIDDTKTLPRN